MASDTALFIACFSCVPVVLRTVGGEVAPASALAPKVGPMGLVRGLYRALCSACLLLPPPRLRWLAALLSRASCGCGKTMGYTACSQ